MRLYVRAEIDALCRALTELQRAIVQRAAAEAAVIMPGFTHLQIAQPVTFGHHMLAWNEMLERDYARLRDARVRVNVSPLGSAALAGASFAIDREMTAAELGFAGLSRNSLDAVSDRDFAIEFASAVALLMVHLSRVAEEIALWCSDTYRFVELSDAFTTGSSIMPQKKNPDVAELIRGKSARAAGNLTALLMLMKAQPLAYNRDNQEDKAPLFDSADTARACVEALAAMLPTMRLNRKRMLEAAAARARHRHRLGGLLGQARRRVPRGARGGRQGGWIRRVEGRAVGGVAVGGTAAVLRAHRGRCVRRAHRGGFGGGARAPRRHRPGAGEGSRSRGLEATQSAADVTVKSLTVKLMTVKSMTVKSPNSQPKSRWPRALAITVTATVLLAACGQTGPLYLPGDERARMAAAAGVATVTNDSSVTNDSTVTNNPID